MNKSEGHLSRSLGPFTLWGLGVGYVISGMYFGWNLGLPQGGSLGLAIATFFIIIMYVSFSLGYCELACAIPKAGGVFDYASLAWGPYWGFLAGMAQMIEFLFAPPAIASAIGAYFNLFLPMVNPLYFAIEAYFIFTIINSYGVKTAASFELCITLVAVLVLLVFITVTLPYFHLKNVALHALPHGALGVFLAVPFAMWFFLGIEGIANLAEETLNPHKNMMLGFISAITTQVILCLLVFSVSVGVGGWEKIVFSASTGSISDSPLPLALGQIINQEHFLYKLLVMMSLVGLVASFNGILLAAGRVTFELGRKGFIPRILGRVQTNLKTPIWALVVNMLIGILALLTGKTAELITLACFGALTIYAVSMCSLIKLKSSHPHLPRSFCTPFYPYTPIIAFSLAFLFLIVMSIFNPKIAIIYFSIFILSSVWFKFFIPAKEKDLFIPMRRHYE